MFIPESRVPKILKKKGKIKGFWCKFSRFYLKLVKILYLYSTFQFQEHTGVTQEKLTTKYVITWR